MDISIDQTQLIEVLQARLLKVTTENVMLEAGLQGQQIELLALKKELEEKNAEDSSDSTKERSPRSSR